MVTLREFQEVSAEWLSRRKKGLVKAPAGSGKTIIAASALDRVLTRKPRDRPARIGVMCNTREQAQQWQTAFDLFESIKNLAFVKIACAAAGSDWSGIDCLIIDECHHATAPEWLAQIKTCRGALWGVTATPKIDDEVRDADLRLLFGNEVHFVQREEVEESKQIVGGRVVMLDDSDDCGEAIDEDIEARNKALSRGYRYADVAELKRKLSFAESQSEKAKLGFELQRIAQEAKMIAIWAAIQDIGIIRNERRNNAVLEIAARHIDDYVITLVNQVEYGKEMAGKIGPHALACYSKMGVKKRKAALEAFKAGRCRNLVATSLADEGLDLPMASVLILVSGGRSKVKAEQRTGRVLRAFKGKTEGLIYDFSDRQHSMMAKQSDSRVALYRSLGYEVTGAVNATLKNI